MARQHPETRDECVAIITRQLERLDRGDTELNGFLVSELLDLKAEKAAPAIKQAFGARCVDESIVGRWEDVEWELGLRAEKPPPYTGNRAPNLFPAFSQGYLIERPPRDHQAKARSKAMRKQAAKARKRNRKKKK
jgi:hypothetical protein